MAEYRDSLLNFTDNAWNELYEIVDDPAFAGQAAEQIYRDLAENRRPVPFCDYLKRFLYDAAALSGPYEAIPLKEYQGILSAAFRETGAPVSFEESSTKMSAAFTNWLTQKAATRGTVLLLGFGLSLSLSEVNAFLLKALHQGALDPSVPRECMAAFCYEHGYTFPKFKEYQVRFEKDRWDHPSGEETVLFQKLKELKAQDPGRSDARAFASFLSLYDQVRRQLAEEYNQSRREIHSVKPEDISPADVESILYEGVPRDGSDNLLPLKLSSLSGIFSDRRLSRKRIRALLRGETSTDRSDLITLNFFLWARKDMSAGSPQKRFISFSESTNQILRQCGLGELYSALPYECFLMMCLLTQDPFRVYTDVWEKAYQSL